jgi:hypothetical protein
MRWVAGVVGIMVGLFLITLPFTLDLLDTAAAADRALDEVEPFFTDEGLAELRGAVDDIDAATVEAQGGGTDALVAALDATSASFARDYPDAAELLSNLEASAGAAEGTVANLEVHQEDYEEAKEIPGLGLPVRAGPWITFAFGLVVLAAGITAIRSPGSVPVAVLLGVGLALVVLPLVFRYPARLDATTDTLDSITPTADAVERTRQQVEGAEAGLDELAEAVFPDAAERTGVSTAAFESAFADSYPAFADVVARRGQYLEPFVDGLALRRDRLNDLIILQDAPITAVLWIHLVPGLLLIVGAGATLVASRDRVAPL